MEELFKIEIDVSFEKLNILRIMDIFKILMLDSLLSSNSLLRVVLK